MKYNIKLFFFSIIPIFLLASYAFAHDWDNIEIIQNRTVYCDFQGVCYEGNDGPPPNGIYINYNVGNRDDWRWHRHHHNWHRWHGYDW